MINVNDNKSELDRKSKFLKYIQENKNLIIKIIIAIFVVIIVCSLIWKIIKTFLIFILQTTSIRNLYQTFIIKMAIASSLETLNNKIVRNQLIDEIEYIENVLIKHDNLWLSSIYKLSNSGLRECLKNVKEQLKDNIPFITLSL